MPADLQVVSFLLFWHGGFSGRVKPGTMRIIFYNQDLIFSFCTKAYSYPAVIKTLLRPLFQNRTLNVLGVLNLMWYSVSERRVITPTARLLHFSLLFIRGETEGVSTDFPRLAGGSAHMRWLTNGTCGVKGRRTRTSVNEKALLQVCGAKFMTVLDMHVQLWI